LRKLVPDAELIRRRAAGETFRELALDYDVAYTTLVRYFQRPEVAKQVKQAARQLRVEQRAAVDRRSVGRRLEQDVRQKAKEQAKRERESARRAAASAPAIASRRRGERSSHGAWLDERDGRVPLTRADRHSQNDRTAADVVAAGGGLQDVIEATGLRTLENVVGLIDPAILKHALDNDVLSKAQPPSV
jgi:hypothetical protein